MARFQSNHARGILQVPEPLSAGALCFVRFDFIFAATFTFGTDQLEIGILPAFATIRDAVLIGNSGGVNTANVGMMAGTPGDILSANGARAVTANLFAATSINATVTRASIAAAWNIAPDPSPRSIGVELTANITGGTNNMSLLLSYSM